jgi:hypothetical protein
MRVFKEILINSIYYYITIIFLLFRKKNTNNKILDLFSIIIILE